MEESVLLTNITMIITKDILVDEGNSQKKPKHFLWHSHNSKPNVNNEMRFPLLDAMDDEDEEFFVKQQFLSEVPASNVDKKSETPIKIEESEKTIGQILRKRLTVRSPDKCHEQKRHHPYHYPPEQASDEMFMNQSEARAGDAKKHKELNLLNKFENLEFEGYLHMSKMSFLVSSVIHRTSGFCTSNGSFRPPCSHKQTMPTNRKKAFVRHRRETSRP